jgi:hypothetical protein
MFPFEKADPLKKRYLVFGCFYELELNGTMKLPCRNVLEIYDRNAYKADEIPGAAPDAVVIMMNPGKSAPLDDTFVPPRVKSRNLNLIYSRETLVEARPDHAQYQIMRLMSLKNWTSVRILNLSDIREPDSQRFAKIIQHPLLAEHSVHSLFSPKRTNELRFALQRKKGAPIIAAWGKAPFLIPLAEMCLSAIDQDVIGIASDTHPMLFDHACPSLQSQKVEWLKAIMEKLP